MNILVVGNGFDLAHGLPTSYSDFLQFTNDFLKIREGKKDEKCNTFLKELFGKRKEEERCNDIINELEELIDQNIWIRHFNNVKALSGQNWIDFEKEISQIIQTLDAARKSMDKQFKMGKNYATMETWQWNILSRVVYSNDLRMIYNQRGLENKDMIYWKNTLLKDMNRLIRCLEIYLYEYVNKLEVENIFLDIKDLKIDRVLSFNYTNTFERIYGTDNNEKVEYDYIHGKASGENVIDRCNMIIGIDEYLEGLEREKDNEFIEFKKFYQRIFKKTGCIYRDWLEQMDYVFDFEMGYSSSNLNIYIWGHSLDITDKDILKDLVEAPGAQVIVFYHTREAFGKQIMNMTKIIGPDKLIARVHGKQASIKFVEQYTAKRNKR